jgi:two-component system nitrogen regulation sensor histidine kinase NtrY
MPHRLTQRLYILSSKLQWLLHQRIALLLLAVLCLAVSIPLYDSLSRPQPLKELAGQLQAKLKQLENGFYALSTEHALIERLAAGQATHTDLDRLSNLGYGLFVYRADTLQFWNTNTILPEPETMPQHRHSVTFRKLQNGYYQLIKKPYLNADGSATDIMIVATQLIKLDYGIENIYLQNNLNPALDAPSIVGITQQETDDLGNYYPLTCDFDKSNLKVYYDKSKMEKRVVMPVVMLQLLSWLFFLLLAHGIARDISTHYSPILGCLLLSSVLVATRLLTVVLDYPMTMSNFWLFDRYVFKTTPLFLSPADMFISLVLMLWAIGFVHYHLPVNIDTSAWSKSKKKVAYCGANLLGFGFFYAAIIALRTLTLDFDINFTLDFDNLANLKGLVGLISLSLVLLSLFVLLTKISVFIWSLRIESLLFRTLFLSFVVVFYGLIQWFYFSDAWSWIFMLPLLIYLGHIHFAENVVRHAYRYFTLKRLAFWVFVYTTFAAFILYGFSNEREKMTRMRLAENIAKQRESSTEFNFEGVAKKITMSDDVVQAFFRNPDIGEDILTDHVKNTIMGAHFSHYDLKIYTFDSMGLAMRGDKNQIKLLDYDLKITHRFKTDNDYLFVALNPATGGYMYLSKLPIFDSESPTLLGYMMVEMIPKSNRQSNVYPELTIEDKFRQPKEADQYSYAIYQKNRLETSAGNYEYNYFRDPIFSASDSIGHFITQNGYSHYVFAERESQIVVVSHQLQGFLALLSLLSYLFAFALIVIIVILTIATIVQRHNIYLGVRDLLFVTLRKRINFAIVCILLLSFSIIAAITVTYLYNRSTDNYRRRLEQKQQEILMALEDALREVRFETAMEGSWLNDNLYPIVSKISEIHGIDINLFSANGFLRSCSQPTIFEQKLIAAIIDPKAYQEIKHMHHLRHMQNERIGELVYLASYLPIKNENGKLVGILNIPYFSKEKELRSEISTFLVTLINAYVVLLLGSGIFGIYLANSVTNPLVMIGEKLKSVRLGQQNEQLSWDDDDEIGALVKQYNLTIAELEKSAERLASTERQQAWQEMAKQVAHEIKNPLTPMKLSIQHLQRAYKEGRPNLKEMTERVTQTIVEQIDTLSQIASEFSDFAKMPKPQNEILDLRDIISNVTNLLENSSTTRLHSIVPPEPCYVYADKNQLLRVFNNLVKNAIQAIPDDRQGIVVINAKRTANWVIVAVVDNGIGIDDETRDKVFKPKFTTKSSGMGLGLAMSRNIIEGAYGKIWFESKSNEGTTFFVRLPFYEPPIS